MDPPAPASSPDAGAVCPNPSCFVLGPHRSGTTIACKAIAASGAFVCLTAADIVAFHERSGAPGSARRERADGRSTLATLARRGETRKIDAIRVSEDLPEEYGFLLPDLRLTPETAPVVASVYRELAGKGAREARYLLRNPWDLANARAHPRALSEREVRLHGPRPRPDDRLPAPGRSHGLRRPVRVSRAPCPPVPTHRPAAAQACALPLPDGQAAGGRPADAVVRAQHRLAGSVASSTCQTTGGS